MAQIGSPESEVEELEASLESIQEHVFTPACATCHSGESPAGEMDLSSVAASREALVEVSVVNAVAAENRWLRVKPGEPEISFLLRKLTSPGLGEGAPMPPGESKLHDYYIELIARWIEEGAP